MHSIARIWKQHENSKNDSHVKHVLYISYIYVDVIMFFVLIKRDTGLGFEKFSHLTNLCVYSSNIYSSDTACAFAHREPKIHYSQFPRIQNRADYADGDEFFLLTIYIDIMPNEEEELQQGQGIVTGEGGGLGNHGIQNQMLAIQITRSEKSDNDVPTHARLKSLSHSRLLKYRILGFAK